jgi:hypothetical protein
MPRGPQMADIAPGEVDAGGVFVDDFGMNRGTGGAHGGFPEGEDFDDDPFDRGRMLRRTGPRPRRGHGGRKVGRGRFVHDPADMMGSELDDFDELGGGDEFPPRGPRRRGTVPTRRPKRDRDARPPRRSKLQDDFQMSGANGLGEENGSWMDEPEFQDCKFTKINLRSSLYSH